MAGTIPYVVKRYVDQPFRFVPWPQGSLVQALFLGAFWHTIFQPMSLFHFSTDFLIPLLLLGFYSGVTVELECILRSGIDHARPGSLMHFLLQPCANSSLDTDITDHLISFVVMK